MARKAPVSSRTRERIAVVRGRIAAASLGLFLRRGFHGTGVREIAAATGVSVGTIFNYYDSKEEILFALISEMQKGVAIPFQNAARDYRERANAGEDPERALLTLLRDYTRSVDRWRRHILLAYREARSLPQPQLQQVLDGERRMRDLLADLIQIGVERGKFTGGDLRSRAHALQALAQSWATRHSPLGLGRAPGVRGLRGQLGAHGAGHPAGAGRSRGPLNSRVPLFFALDTIVRSGAQ